jgi:hypothetical protein
MPPNRVAGRIALVGSYATRRAGPRPALRDACGFRAGGSPQSGSAASTENRYQLSVMPSGATRLVLLHAGVEAGASAAVGAGAGVSAAGGPRARLALRGIMRPLAHKARLSRRCGLNRRPRTSLRRWPSATGGWPARQPQNGQYSPCSHWPPDPQLGWSQDLG